MTKFDVMKRLGLSIENFNFYVQMKRIWKIKNKKDQWDYDKKMNHEILEKDTVFKYYFNDNWREHVKIFKEAIEHTGRVKYYTKKEIEEYQKKKDMESKGLTYTPPKPKTQPKKKKNHAKTRKNKKNKKS